jgi:hypothetical protein
VSKHSQNLPDSIDTWSLANTKLEIGLWKKSNVPRIVRLLAPSKQLSRVQDQTEERALEA